MKTAIVLIFCVCSLAKSEENYCKSHSSCDECIQTSSCIWDFNPNFPSSKSRCNTIANAAKISTLENVYNPENELSIIEQRPIGDNVSLSPQKARMKLRLNEAVSLTIDFKDMDSLPPPHLDNILVEYTRDQPKRLHVSIKAISCPRDPKKFKQTLDLTSYQSNQTLSLEIEIICTCPCEKLNQMEVRSERCYTHGTYKCGICECDDGYFGRRCECGTLVTPDDCTFKGSQCSSRGQCICGHCECQQRDDPNEFISGKYCECDNFSCDRVEGKLCGGTEHGVCECGVCHCKDGWSGAACDTSA